MISCLINLKGISLATILMVVLDCCQNQSNLGDLELRLDYIVKRCFSRWFLTFYRLNDK